MKPVYVLHEETLERTEMAIFRPPKLSSSPSAWDFRNGELPYADALYGSALRLTRNRQDAEDLLQETFLRAYAHYDGFTEGTNLKAWLFRILKNAFINGYRRTKAGPREVDFGAGGDEALDVARSKVPEGGAGATPEEGLLAATLDRGVADALAALPEDFRLVVELVDLQDFSYREVADILEVPLGTVMSRLYRGRRLLESALLDYGRRRHYFGPQEPSRTRLAAPGQDAARSPASQNPVTLSEYRRRRER